MQGVNGVVTPCTRRLSGRWSHGRADNISTVSQVSDTLLNFLILCTEEGWAVPVFRCPGWTTGTVDEASHSPSVPLYPWVVGQAQATVFPVEQARKAVYKTVVHDYEKRGPAHGALPYPKGGSSPGRASLSSSGSPARRRKGVGRTEVWAGHVSVCDDLVPCPRFVPLSGDEEAILGTGATVSSAPRGQ